MKEAGKVTIVVHSGGYHSDDIFSVASLMLMLGDDKDIEVIRTRDMAIIKAGDFVADVGGEYDEQKNRFDHHQIGGAGVRPNGVPYASFGLVWKKFGEKICGSLELAKRIEERIVLPVDAIDNGVQIVELKISSVHPYDIGDFFDAFSPTWKESENNIGETFLKMVSFAKMTLEREIEQARAKIESDYIVKGIYDKAEDKRLVVFDKYYPYKYILSKFPEPLFAVFPNEFGNWVLHGIKEGKVSFDYRKYLPLEWAGKTDEELEKTIGVNGAVFCHIGRFIAVAKTKEAILKMASIALG